MLTLYRPFSDIERFHREFRNQLLREPDGEADHFRPVVDIEEDDHRVLITADLPGVKQEDLEITVKDGVLLLSGKRESKLEEKTDVRYYSERCTGAFFRQFRLGRKVDPEKIQATLQDGVLTIELPKRAEAQPRQIPVVTG